MYRCFLSKSPLLKDYTWSQCVYYLRIFGYRHFSETAGSSIVSEKNDEELVTNSGQYLETTVNGNPSRAPTAHRMMDRNPEDMYRRYILKPDQPENARLLRVAIIGAPNAGKSTLINNLCGWKANGVSCKVHTTRQNANTVFTIDNVQIVFVDTPGVLSQVEGKKHHCDRNIMAEPERSLHEADAVGVIVDAENKWTRYQLHTELLKVLYLHKNIPAFLILNKVDTLRNTSFDKQQRTLLSISRRLCDGILDGKQFGMSKLEQKKDKKKGQTKYDFEELERKYGKLGSENNKTSKKGDFTTDLELRDMEGKDIKKDLPKENLKINPRVDYVSDYKKKLKLTNMISDIIEQSDKTRPSVTGYQKKKVSESSEDDIYDSTNTSDFHELKNIDKQTGDIFIEKAAENLNVENDSYISFKTSVESEQVSPKNNITQNEESTRAEGKESARAKGVPATDDEKSSIKVIDDVCSDSSGETEHFIDDSEVCSSDMSTVYTEQKQLANEANIDSEEIKPINLENSYQSEFLQQILSRPPLLDLTFVDNFVDETQPQVSEEMLLIKEAITAVKGMYGWKGFDRVFPVSALDGSGIDVLKEYLVEISQSGDWVYHSSVVTDQHPYDIAKMCVKQSLLDNVNSYLPYVVQPEITYWDVDDHNRLNIIMSIKLENSYEMSMVLGHGGKARVQSISSSARQALMSAFQSEVRFKLEFTRRKKKT